MTRREARVLVVEDHRETSALLRELLEAEGWDVESVATGEAAFQSLELAPDIDLLVLDLMLPGMSGYEVIERLRAEATLSRIPILVLSALSSPAARVRGLREGADDYMTKPFLPEELVARARTLVTAHLLERRTREIEALGHIAQATLTATDSDALLQGIAGTLGAVFEADAALVLLVEGGALRVRGTAGAPDAVARPRVPVGVGVAGRVVATREPLLIADGAASDARAAGDPLRVETFRAVMAAPLLVGGAAIGAIEVGRRSRRLDPRADRLLRLVADRAAVGIEHARLASEARELADVVRRIGEGVVVADADDRIAFANRAFQEMVGAAAEELGGVRWPELLGSAQDPTLTARLRQPLFEGELLLIARGGEPRPVHLTVSTVEGRDGRRQRIAVFRDISREHELRFRVIREQKFRTLGSLAAGVAHNINNRLTPVLGWTEMLLERLAAGEAVDAAELKHALTVIHQGASDGVATVRRLQEYSRPPRFRGPEVVHLREIVEQLLALTRPQWDNEAARRGVRYEIDLRAAPAPPILAVASELREALLNLIENALAAMPDGGRLTIEIRGDRDRAVLAVSDTGRGMSPEVQRLAFEPFFTTRAAEGGTGLGLSLAQEIVHRYGGTIALQSQEGVGTTFTLSFPAASAERGDAAVFLPVLEPLRVLAVEDEPEVLDLLRAMLSHAGHAVLGAASGREALALFEREVVDLVITDLGMAGMTGLALAAELKRRRAVPVVLLTGWADELDAASLPDVDVVLPKPFSRERLFGALARAVPGRVRSA